MTATLDYRRGSLPLDQGIQEELGMALGVVLLLFLQIQSDLPAAMYNFTTPATRGTFIYLYASIL